MKKKVMHVLKVNLILRSKKQKKYKICKKN